MSTPPPGTCSPTTSGVVLEDSVMVMVRREQTNYGHPLQATWQFRERQSALAKNPIRPRQFVTRNAWNSSDTTKTNHACLAMCLGSMGWEDDDDGDERPGKVYCWRRPRALAESPAKAVERLGTALEAQYDRHRKNIFIRQCLNPTVDEVKDALHRLRRAAGSDKVLFHYSGHWCFRDNVTVPMPRPHQNYFYLMNHKGSPAPFPVEDMLQLLGLPAVLVFDCPSAGTVLNHLNELMIKDERAQTQRFRQQPDGGDPMAGGSMSSLLRTDCYFMGACSAGEALPYHHLLPNDILTACITTPVQMSLLWFCIQHRQFADINPMLIHCIPGALEDRKSLLGELKWIFVAITDCIAWGSMPQELFYKLFRQDTFVVSLFRGYLLAERIITSLGCTPQSYPKMPSAAKHSQWQTWDCVLDDAVSTLVRQLTLPPTSHLSLGDLRGTIDLSAVPRSLQNAVEQLAPHQPSGFFANELKSFHAMLYELEREPQSAPHLTSLAIIPHALCSVASRLDAMHVLCRLVDRGAWAVDQCEQVRMFNEVLNRLWGNTVVDLREMMVFVFCKSVFVDPLLVPVERRGDAVAYVARVLRSPTNQGRLGIFSSATCQRLLAVATLAILCHNNITTHELVMREKLLPELSALLDELMQPQDTNQSVDEDPRNQLFAVHLKVSVCVLITVLLYSGDQVTDFFAATLFRQLSTMLTDSSPMVRHAVVRTLHTFVCAAISQEQMDAVVTVVMAHAGMEGNATVRVEIISLLYHCASKDRFLQTVPADELRRAITPMLNGNRRDSSATLGMSAISPVMLPPAAMMTTPMMGSSVIAPSSASNTQTAFENGEEGEESDGGGSVPLSPQLSPHPSLMTPNSGPSSFWARARFSQSGPIMPDTSDSTLTQTEGSAAAARGSHFPSAPLHPHQDNTHSNVALGMLHLIAVFSTDVNPWIRAHGCKAISQLVDSGVLPFSVQQQRQEVFTPKQSQLDKMFSFLRSSRSKATTSLSVGDLGGAGGGPLELEDFDVSLKRINLEDLSTAADFVYDSLALLGKPLLGTPDERDPRNPVNICMSQEVETHVHSVATQLNESLLVSSLSNGLISKTTADADVKTVVFHPSDSHLVTINGQDAVTVWRYDEGGLRPTTQYRVGAQFGKLPTESSSAVNTSATPKTPTAVSQRVNSYQLPAASGGISMPKLQVTSACIVDAACNPLLAVASAAGSVTLLKNYQSTTPSIVSNFSTMLHEHAIHSHHCDMAYQPMVHHVHVTGWMGSISTWDLSYEQMVTEVQEVGAVATMLAAHPESAFCFGVASSSGSVLIFDTRVAQTAVHKLEGLKSSALTMSFNRTSPQLITAASSNGTVQVWDERRFTSSSSPSVRANSVIDTFSLLAPKEKKHKSGLDQFSAIDFHSASVVPLSLSGGGTRFKVNVRADSMKKFQPLQVRTQITTCRWHPNRFMGVVAAQGKLAVVEQPVVSDVTMAGDVFDF